jgi:hypothetical protein
MDNLLVSRIIWITKRAALTRANSTSAAPKPLSHPWPHPRPPPNSSVRRQFQRLLHGRLLDELGNLCLLRGRLLDELSSLRRRHGGLLEELFCLRRLLHHLGRHPCAHGRRGKGQGMR